MAPHVIDPLNKYKVTWDLLIGVIYLISYMLDPVVLAFKFEPLETESIMRFCETVTVFIIIDMFLVPFTAVRKEDDVISDLKEKRKE
mgnify:FL=1